MKEVKMKSGVSKVVEIWPFEVLPGTEVGHWLVLTLH